MSNLSLPSLLADIHRDVHGRLKIARRSIAHPSSKGDASETAWINVLSRYLPQRYQAKKAFVIDSKNNSSEQIDIVVFDRQYSPLVFEHEGCIVVPAESVYAAFEVKQAVDKGSIEYTKRKLESVRKLHRTSLPIPYAESTYPPKAQPHIIGGLLTLDSSWNPPCGEPLTTSLGDGTGDDGIDIGCISAHGYYSLNREGNCYDIVPLGESSTTAFLFRLISLLQSSGTVPMIDLEAYARWLGK